MKSMFYPDMELRNPMSYRGYNYPASSNSMPSFDPSMLNQQGGFQGMNPPQGQPDLSPMPTYAPENVNPTLGQIPDSMPNTNLAQYTGNGFVDGYAQGGIVQDNSYGEMSHINPLEAALLESMYGHSTVPDTGLPHYGKGGLFGRLITHPIKTLNKLTRDSGAQKRALGDAAAIGGAIFGGPVGGAIGGGIRSYTRNEPIMGGAVRGGFHGAIAAPAAQLAGYGAKSVGMNGVGDYLTRHGIENSGWTGSLGNMMSGSPATQAGGAWWNQLGFGGGAGSNAGGSAAAGEKGLSSQYMPLVNRFTETARGSTTVPSEGGEASKSKIPNANDDFVGSLMGKSKNFLSEPANLLSLAAVAAPILYREKQKSPEQLGEEEKRRYLAAHNLSPEEIARKEASDLAQAQAARRVSRNRFLPEERLGNLPGMYSRSSTPEEAARTGRWVNYYDNDQHSGAAIPYKDGGMTGGEESMDNFLPMTNEEVIYFKGSDGGQDDTRRVSLPENGYVANASVVSGLGDGNSDAGAREIEAMVSDGEVYISPKGVKAIGKGKHSKGIKKLEKMSKRVMKAKGGKTTLPAKAKSIKEYMR